MIKNVSKVAIVVAALAALPGMAQAGTDTATGTATFSVNDQCSVTGATVNLGTYNVNDTWGTVGSQIGYVTSGGLWIPSPRGYELLNFGSVTCDSGTPYTLTVKGTATGYLPGAISLVIGGRTAIVAPYIKKVGTTTIADSSALGAGTRAWTGTGVAATGTGAAQSLIGHANLNLVYSPGTLATDKLTTAGTYSDTLTYTLTF